VDSPEAVAHHESGHAVAAVLAFRRARWLPRSPPRLPVRYCEIGANGTGTTAAKNIYCPTWPIDVLVPRYRPLMEAQVCIYLAGGVAEAIHRCGPRSGRELWSVAESCCAVDGDLQRVADVFGDLRRLTGYDLYPQHFADRTAEMLLTHWCAVEALAAALVDERRMEGRRVERIVVEAIEGVMAQ